MKINIWIEVSPWNVDINGELKDQPYITFKPFEHPCSDNIQRFKAEIDIPYVFEKFPVPTVEAKAEGLK